MFRPELSIVVAVDGLSTKIDDFFSSLFSQTMFPASWEIIVVHSGVASGEADIASRWHTENPQVVRIVHEGAISVADARNAGLRAAKGKWVTFPNPQDLFDRDYFRHMLTAARQSSTATCVLSHLRTYRDDTGDVEDSHLLRHAFPGDSDTPITRSDPGDYIIGSLGQAWIRRRAIPKNQIRRDLQGFSSLRDAEFVYRVLAASRRPITTVAPRAIYLCRLSTSGSGAADLPGAREGALLEQRMERHLTFLNWVEAQKGSAPPFIQRWTLYLVVDLLQRHMLPRGGAQDIFIDRSDSLHAALQGVFGHIDVSVIDTFSFPGFFDEHRVGLLWAYKGIRKTPTRVYLRQLDEGDGLA